MQGDEHVSRGAELFTIVRNDVLELAAAVPERLATGVRAGQKVTFATDGRAFEGKVARVSPTVDPTTRAVTVFVEIPNPGGTLRGNLFVTGRVVGRTINDALVIPTSALRQVTEQQAAETNGPRDFVYRIAANVVERAPVSLGVVDEATGIAEVVDGLREGDKVVVGNVGTVGQGVRVQILGERSGRGGPGGPGGAGPADGAGAGRPPQGAAQGAPQRPQGADAAPRTKQP